MSLPQSITRHKAQSGQGIVEYALVAFLVIVVIIVIVAVMYPTLTGKQPTCADYANFTINAIPVRCYSYFGITGAAR